MKSCQKGKKRGFYSKQEFSLHFFDFCVDSCRGSSLEHKAYSFIQFVQMSTCPTRRDRIPDYFLYGSLQSKYLANITCWLFFNWHTVYGVSNLLFFFRVVMHKTKHLYQNDDEFPEGTSFTEPQQHSLHQTDH